METASEEHTLSWHEKVSVLSGVARIFAASFLFADQGVWLIDRQTDSINFIYLPRQIHKVDIIKFFFQGKWANEIYGKPTRKLLHISWSLISSMKSPADYEYLLIIEW